MLNPIAIGSKHISRVWILEIDFDRLSLTVHLGFRDALTINPILFTSLRLVITSYYNLCLSLLVNYLPASAWKE